MQILIVGGRLQGVEAAYLAKKAGYTSVVIDKDQNAPASGLCDIFLCGDATDAAFFTEACIGVNVILPAIENEHVLQCVSQQAEKLSIPFIFDPAAYAISSSKLASDAMFAELDIPRPLPWPQCGFPLLAKPSGMSGSHGVKKISNQAQLDRFLQDQGMDQTVLQQYLEGPSYSIEVIGNGIEYIALQTTELFMDPVYDCCRVTAPARLSHTQESELRETAFAIARKLQIKGIFDVEVILHNGACKVLEIDARLPSQTPTAVLHSTGLNMLEILCKMAITGKLSHPKMTKEKHVLYQHLLYDHGSVSLSGEYAMGCFGKLAIRNDFLKADASIISNTDNQSNWAATLIYEGCSKEDLIGRQQSDITLAQAIDCEDSA